MSISVAVYLPVQVSVEKHCQFKTMLLHSSGAEKAHPSNTFLAERCYDVHPYSNTCLICLLTAYFQRVKLTRLGLRSRFKGNSLGRRVVKREDTFLTPLRHRGVVNPNKVFLCGKFSSSRRGLQHLGALPHTACVGKRGIKKAG